MTNSTNEGSEDQRRFNRREILNAGARTLMVGTLLAYFVQQRERGKLLANDPSCIRLDTCTDCIEFGGCSLPKSHAHREHVKQSADGTTRST